MNTNNSNNNFTSLEQKIEALENLAISSNPDWESILTEDILNYSELMDEMESQSLLQIDFIGYSASVAYLAENDPSLHRTAELCRDYAIQWCDVSSEFLASILATQIYSDELSSLQSEIDAILQ